MPDKCHYLAQQKARKPLRYGVFGKLGVRKLLSSTVSRRFRTLFGGAAINRSVYRSGGIRATTPDAMDSSAVLVSSISDARFSRALHLGAQQNDDRAELRCEFCSGAG